MDAENRYFLKLLRFRNIIYMYHIMNRICLFVTARPSEVVRSHWCYRQEHFDRELPLGYGLPAPNTYLENELYCALWLGNTVPNATWCPWNYYRTSGDIRASYEYVVSNLMTTIPFAKQSLSQPGCWAYPGSTFPIFAFQNSQEIFYVLTV